MKKFCSLALVLCMLLTLVVIPTAAEPATEHITFADTDTTYTDSEGTVYTILRTKEDFLAIQNGKNYIFGADINLDISYSGTNASVFGAGKAVWYEGIMDGNGYAIYGYTITSSNNGGLFYWGTGASSYKTANVVFKNLSFGTEANPLSLKSGGNGGLGAIAGKVGKDSVVKVINCDVYANLDDVNSSDRKANKGAFFGYTLGANISFTFEDCTTNGVLNAKNKNGGYIGSINQAGCSASFKNCVNNMTLNCANQGAAGFIGQVNYSTAILSFENCVNNANITGTTDGVGGLVGYSTSFNITIKNCQNNGTITASAGVPKADFVGHITVAISRAPLAQEALGDAISGCNVTLRAKLDDSTSETKKEAGKADAAWQKTEADENGNVKVRLLVAVNKSYFEKAETATFTGTFGLTAGGSKTLTLTLGGEKRIKCYSSVIANGETLEATAGYVIIPVVVENIPEAEWDGTVSIKLESVGTEADINDKNYVANYCQYN